MLSLTEITREKEETKKKERKMGRWHDNRFLVNGEQMMA